MELHTPTSELEPRKDSGFWETLTIYRKESYEKSVITKIDTSDDRVIVGATIVW